jgi:transcriptional regulator with XRE-family HTH domain
MLSELRSKHHRKQEEVAEHLGIERSYYGRLERGKRPFSVPMLHQALVFLDANEQERLTAFSFYGKAA